MSLFSGWLGTVIVQRGISQADLARDSGLSQAHISKLVSGKSGAGITTCVALAKALGLSVDYVMRQAGILDTPVDYDALCDEWGPLLHALDDDSRADLKKMADTLLEQQRRRELFLRDYNWLSDEQMAEIRAMVGDYMVQRGWVRLEE